MLCVCCINILRTYIDLNYKDAGEKELQER